MGDTNLQQQIVGVGEPFAGIFQISTERWLDYGEVNAILLRQIDPNPPFIATEELFGPGPPYREGLFLYPNIPMFSDNHNWTPVNEPRRMFCRSFRLGELVGYTLAELVAEDGDGGFFWRRTHHHRNDGRPALVHYRREIPLAANEDEDQDDDDDDDDDDDEDEHDGDAEAEAAEAEAAEAAAAEAAAAENEPEDESEDESTDEDDFVNDPTYQPGRRYSGKSQSMVDVGQLRDYATASAQKTANVKVPVALVGESGNFASWLYIAAVKMNSLEKIESDLSELVEAMKTSPTFSQFTKDPSVPRETRLAAIVDVAEPTKNVLCLLAENGKLKNLDGKLKKFMPLTTAHRGDVKPLPPAEEKELKETLHEIIGERKNLTVEQKIDPSIYGGLSGQKVSDMSFRTRAQQMERLLRDFTNL